MDHNFENTLRIRGVFRTKKNVIKWRKEESTNVGMWKHSG